MNSTRLMPAAVLLAWCGIMVGLASCGAFSTPEPTPTHTPTPEPSATLTPRPTTTSTPTRLPPTATRTRRPSQTPKATSGPAGSGNLPLALPLGDPAASWEGIPIMPGATAGEDKGDSYVFTIDTDREAVIAYFEVEMPRAGWEALAVGTGEMGPVLLIFQKGSQIATVSVLDFDADTVYVMILVN